VKSFSTTPDQFPYFRTIHSLAYFGHEVLHTQVMRDEHWKEFAELGGWDMARTYEDISRRPTFGHKLGDQLLRAYSMARARGVTIIDEYRSSRVYNFPFFALERFTNDLEAFKQSLGLLDFNDFLDEPIFMDVDVLFVDEAQDLTHQQWKFLRQTFKETPNVIIAGDDDQCIYEWNGADLEFFLNIEGKITTLPISYRLPKEIYDRAIDLTSRIEHRYKKKWKPARKGGSVTWLPEDQVDITSGEWLLLARHRRAIPRLVKMAKTAGRIYFNGRKWSNEYPWFKAVLSYESIRSNGTISNREAQNLIRFCSDSAIRDRGLHEVRYENILWRWGENEAPDWMDALDGLSANDREYIRSVRRRGENVRGPGSVTISTIHGAKGGEADNVLLLTYQPGSIKKAALDNPEAELRVWYVGISRAKQNLIICGPTQYLRLK